MENKINIVELLKGCYSGMELDCTIYEDVTLYEIDDSPENEYPIRIKTKNGYSLDLTKHGAYSDTEEAKCVIFPKGKTTWEGFAPPCKFKVGDKITDKNKFIYRITEITDKGYKLHDLKTTFITFEEADLYFVKVVDIFDINTLKPFERVLVRDDDDESWEICLFGHCDESEFYQYKCINGCVYAQCIPYEGNEHLLGTTNDCDVLYKKWQL